MKPMSLLPVDDALTKLLDGAEPKPAEMVPLSDAAGRTLAADVFARRTQPPFDASAMDGYAVRAADIASLPATLKIISLTKLKSLASVMAPTLPSKATNSRPTSRSGQPLKNA